MVLLEAATSSGARALSADGLRMKVGMAVGGRTGGDVGILQPVTYVRLNPMQRAGLGAGPSRTRTCIGIELKASRPARGRGLGWKGGRRHGVGGMMIAARLFGGGRGPCQPRITTPRCPMQGEESSSADESLATEDIGEDSTKRNEKVLRSHLEGSKSEVAVDNAAQVLQDQFNRFAAAVALADRKMAEEIIREMGDGDPPSRSSSLDFSDEEILDSMEELDVSAQLVDDSLYQVPDAIAEFSRDPVQLRKTQYDSEDATDLERQLEELYEEVGRMIDEGDENTARELVEANYEALAEQLDAGVQGVEQAAMLDILAQLYMDMGDSANAEVLLEKANELLEQLHRPQPLLDSVLEHVASMWTAIGKSEEAIPLYIKSLGIQKSVYGKDSPLLTRTMLGLAKAYSDNDEGNRSIELYQHVVVLMESTKGCEDESLVFPLTHLGNTLLEEKREEEAERVLQRAVILTEKAYGVRDGRVGIAKCAVARAKTAQGKVDEAVSLYRQGLSLMKGCSRFSSDDPVVEVVRTDLAELLNVLGRDAEAQDLWAENLRMKERVLGKNDIQLVPHLHNVVTSYAQTGNFEKCEPLLRRSLKLMSNHYGPTAPQVSITLELLATSLHHLGNGFEAEALAREAVSIRESHYGEHHPVTGEAYNCLAAILHGLEKDHEAEELLRKVLKIQERELGPNSPEILLTLELLGMLLHKHGRHAEVAYISHRMQKLESILNSANSIEEE